MKNKTIAKLEDYFKTEAADVSVGDFVEWGYADGTAQGKIVKIVDDGKVDVPDSSFEIEGTKDDPAALIQIYKDGKKTDTKVGHKVSTLQKIDKPG